MRVLITGATGFVGQHLVKRLTERHDLLCLVRKPYQELPKLRGCKILFADLAYPLEPSLLDFSDNLDAIVHLAETKVTFPDKAREFFAGSTTSTLELLEYGRKAGIKSFIYASSGSLYGFGTRQFREDSDLQIKDFYTVSKMCAELLVGTYKDFFNTHILRMFFPYGPGQRGRRIPMIAGRVLCGQPVDLVNEGQPCINPIYVGDLVELIERALSVQGNHIVNVAGDEEISMLNIAELIGELADKKPLFNYATDPFMSDLVANNELMHQLYGVKKNGLTPLREGLRAVVKDMISIQGNMI